MNSSTSQQTNAEPIDPDLAEQAVPGHGIPSQDPDPAAQVLLTPEEAERLAVAQREGSIQLVLRGYGDPDSVKTDGARPNDVLSQLRSVDARRRPTPEPTAPKRPRLSAPSPAPVQPPKTVVIPPNADSVTVRIYRGDKLSQQKFVDKKDSVKRDTIKPPN